jgi:hypothetical protein
MNLRLPSSFAVTVLVACSTPPPRIVAVPPDSGTPGVCSPQDCGATVSVITSLSQNTALTPDECATICASVWCGKKPIGLPPGNPNCMLVDTTAVSCGATASGCGEPCMGATDCGYCFGECVVNPGSCSGGCCNKYSGCCGPPPSALYCRGFFCSDCPPPDPRCSLDACRAFKSCGGQLAAEPSATACADADGGVDPTVDIADFCPDACNAMDAGAAVQAACSDAGTLDAGTLDAGTLDAGTLDAGNPDAGNPDAGNPDAGNPDAGNPDAGSCVEACWSTRTACDRACPRFRSFRDCMYCSAECGVDLGHCLSGCN